jgi:hypothetical protein
MKFRIHFTLSDGSEDSIIVEAASLSEVREKAEAEVKKRGGIDPWSEKVD